MLDVRPATGSGERPLGDGVLAPFTPTTNQRIATIIFAVAAVALGIWTLRGFLQALVWAGIFAIATWPLYERTKKQCPASMHRVALPVLFALAIALILLLPLILFGLQLRHESQIFMTWLQQVRQTGLAAPDWLSQIPFVGSAADDWWQDNLAGPQRAASFLGHLNRGDIVAVGQNVGEQLIRRTVTFTFTIVTLFFLFREGERISASLLYAGRQLFGPRGQQLSRQIAASIHGTVDGLVIVGLGEGLILGIAYYFAGVPNATLFGAATAVAAIIPFGAPLLFTIVAVLLLVQGAKIAAIVIFAFGVLVMAIADHVVRPVIIGGAIRLPFLWVLLGILGGVETWGLLGLFFGPAIMAVLILLWREWTVPPEGTLPSPK